MLLAEGTHLPKNRDVISSDAGQARRFASPHFSDGRWQVNIFDYICRVSMRDPTIAFASYTDLDIERFSC